MPKKDKKKRIINVEPMKRTNNYEEVPLQINIKNDLKNDKKIQPSKIFEKYNDKKIKKKK